MDPADAAAAVQTLYPRVWHTMHRAHPTARSAISPRDTAILVHLAGGEGVSPTDLAAHLGVAAGTLSEALGDLEARGLVARIRDERDRRRVTVHLTDAGRAGIATGSGLDGERLERALADLSPEERARVVDGLALLARACLAVRP